MSNSNDWDNKSEMQALIEKMRDRGMHNNPHLLEARKCLAAELARRKDDRQTFVAIHKGFAANNGGGDYGGGGTHGPSQT